MDYCVFLLMLLILVLQIVKIAFDLFRVRIKKVKFILDMIVFIILSYICLSFKRSDNLMFFNMIMSAIISIYVIVDFIIIIYNRKNKKEITNISIKEAIDKSHSGLLVLKGDNVVLQNSTMESILTNINVFNNYEVEIKKIGEKLDDNVYMIFENKYKWLFEFHKNEIIANDITIEYKLNKEIENKNKKIEQNNKKMLETVEKIKEIEEQKELQKIRTKFHDVFGQNISILYRYLTNKEFNTVKFDDMKFMIKESFENFETTDNSEENLKNLIKVNKMTGTNIILDGKLPVDKVISKVFFEIIREAVTNAIKHAGSNQINIKINNSLQNIKMEITNDGKKPFDEIKEYEGLKGMRRKIEEIGGRILISTDDYFKLSVEV